MLYFKSKLVNNNVNYINIINIVSSRLINHATHVKMKLISSTKQYSRDWLHSVFMHR